VAKREAGEFAGLFHAPLSERLGQDDTGGDDKHRYTEDRRLDANCPGALERLAPGARTCANMTTISEGIFGFNARPFQDDVELRVFMQRAV
jgi:hypothetical protein